MNGVAIYLEGGGDGRDTKAALRQGMDTFLSALKEAVRSRSWHWRLVCCGGRQAAFEAFMQAVRVEETMLVVLLVDAETAVSSPTCVHLGVRDGWRFNGVADDMVHMMIQSMETWIVADVATLGAYYGKAFKPRSLPRTDDLESVAKAVIADALARATRDTQKGPYHKIRHASDLLKRLDPEKVRNRCASCARMFDTLGKAIAAV